VKESKQTTTFDEGLTAQVRGDFGAAIAIFEHVIEDHPTNAAAYHQLGRCHMRLGDLAKAIENLEAAVRLGPERIPARLDLGTLYLATNHMLKAKRQFRQALTRNKSNVKAITGVGIVRYYEEKFDKAKATLRHACTLNPTNLACHYYLAKIHRKLKNIEDMRKEALRSAAICRDLIRVRTEMPEAYFFLAETFRFQRDYRPALQNYLIARDFSPESVMHFFAFGLHYTRVDNYLGIARCYEKLGEHSYARYFGQVTLKIDANNAEAARFASLEDD
jgi:tetratricopeptide (TPR) repeat protein